VTNTDGINYGHKKFYIGGLWLKAGAFYYLQNQAKSTNQYSLKPAKATAILSLMEMHCILGPAL